MSAEAAEATPSRDRRRSRLSAEAAEAHDDAVLDMIALEMAAPDPADVDDPSR